MLHLQTRAIAGYLAGGTDGQRELKGREAPNNGVLQRIASTAT